MEFFELSAVEIATRVRAGKLSASQVLAAHIRRIEALDPVLNCFTSKTFERARAEAAWVDATVQAGGDPGPLAGVPFAVKNLFDIVGLPTLAGSKIRREAAPPKQDSPHVQRLNEAGAVLLGALNMDEFAYGFVTENAHDGPTRNPHDTTRIAGGSSGGSAASVAAGLCVLALGSDTNGSIRLPAGLTGIYGLKPSYGRVTRAGTFPFVDSFDHIGPFARSAADLALAYDVLQDEDEASPVLGEAADAARVAVLDDWFQHGASAEMLEAVRIVADALGGTDSVTLPEAKRARAAAFCISAFEGGQLHKPNLIARPQDYDPATLPRLIAGALQPAETIYQAQRFRAWFREQALKLFERHDLLLAPATPITAPLIGQPSFELAGEQVPLRANIGLYTQPISFIGLPVVCVPVASAKLPRGVQIIAAPGREALALAAAARLEAACVLAAAVVG
ncbi:AtzE family amidohydrolase [Acidocella facilis]|uniref:AtzE family amidohydrolase n=1 Tax=Acidocella facilis TaxID=525 RepID=UPI00047AC52F|nr:AtzE family amidohydrolase [Acidocella facilis]